MSSVCKWFAERSDLILILFDAHKLDISDELKTVIESLRFHAAIILRPYQAHPNPNHRAPHHETPRP